MKSGGRTARGDAMRRREGKLRHIDAQKATGKLDHFGEILGFDDFLDKADQLIDKYDKLPGSMRAEYFTRLRHAVARLRAYLATDVEPRARNALFDTLHAAFDYRSLLDELADDERPDRRRRITRRRYFAALANHKTQESVAEALGVSVTALTKWRKANAVVWTD